MGDMFAMKTLIDFLKGVAGNAGRRTWSKFVWEQRVTNRIHGGNDLESQKNTAQCGCSVGEPKHR